MPVESCRNARSGSRFAHAGSAILTVERVVRSSVGAPLKSPWFRWLFGGLLAAALVGVVLYGVDLGELVRTVSRAEPGALVGVVILTVAAYWARAWRWGALLQPMATVPQRDLFSATMLGFASSLVVPRSGEFLRPWLVSRRHPIPMSAGFATIVIERLVDLVSVVLLFAAYLFVLPRPAAEVSTRWIDALKVGGAVAAAGAVVLLGVLWAFHANAEGTVRRIERLFARAPEWLSATVGAVLQSFSSGLAVLRAPGSHLAMVAFQSAAVWLLTAASLHLVQVAFGIDIPFHTTFLLIAFLVVGESIPTPGLIGGFHAFYLLALVEVYGVDKTTAAAAGIVAHALTNLPVLMIGAALLGRESLSVGTVAAAARDDPLR